MSRVPARIPGRNRKAAMPRVQGMPHRIGKEVFWQTGHD